MSKTPVTGYIRAIYSKNKKKAHFVLDIKSDLEYTGVQLGFLHRQGVGNPHELQFSVEFADALRSGEITLKSALMLVFATVAFGNLV